MHADNGTASYGHHEGMLCYLHMGSGGMERLWALRCRSADTHPDGDDISARMYTPSPYALH